MTDRDRLIELIGKTKQEFDKWCLDCEKDKTTTDAYVGAEQIDNLLNELVGDNNAGEN